MIVALESSSADERLAAARRFLTSRSSGEEILLVGATREAVDDLAHDVSVERGAVFGLHRFSLRHLASRLASGVLADRDLARMTRLGLEAVASRAAFEVKERGALPYFDPVAGCPEFARAVAATVAEVRLAGFASDSLRSLAPAGGEPGGTARRVRPPARPSARRRRGCALVAGPGGGRDWRCPPADPSWEPIRFEFGFGMGADRSRHLASAPASIATFVTCADRTRSHEWLGRIKGRSVVCWT